MRRTVTYLQARLLLLALGLALALGQATLAWQRGAGPLEVLAPILYIPVFAGAVVWPVPGGLAGATLSSVVYGVLLVDQTSAVGTNLFVGLLVNRVATFFFYAIVVAVAVRTLESRLRKLELFDRIDDVTELYNSAFFLEDAELETTRASRYGTRFSVVELVVDREAFTGFSRRRYEQLLRDVADVVRRAIRRVDRASRVDEGRRDLVLVTLPETGPDGAAVVASRVEAAVRQLLASRGGSVEGRVRSRVVGHEDAESLEGLRSRVAAVDERRRALRPEA